jgi:hypothetical protein
LVLDVSGYFAPAIQDVSGLSLYTLTPFRVLDPRLSSGKFQGQLKVPVTTGNNCNVAATGQAYVMNATVVPAGPLGFLTLWPDTISQPVASTLNADDNVVTSNMAIASSPNGSIDAFASSDTQLILDVFSYFAPAPSFTLTTSPLIDNSFMIEPGSTVPFTLVLEDTAKRLIVLGLGPFSVQCGQQRKHPANLRYLGVGTFHSSSRCL